MMKKLIIFSLVISSLISISTLKIDAYRNRRVEISIKRKVLNKDTVSVKGYEGYGFLEYSKTNKKAFDSVKSYLEKHEKIEGTDLSRKDNYSNGNYSGRGFTESFEINEGESTGNDLKNGDKINCSIKKESRNLPFDGNVRIKVKNLKKIPKQIDFKKCDKEVGEAFNQMLYGVDGAGYFEEDFDTRRRESVRPYTSDIDFSNLKVVKVNGLDYLPSRDNGKFKNGDIVTIKIDELVKSHFKYDNIKLLNDTVDVKVNSLINPTRICYKDPQKKITAPIDATAVDDIPLELDKTTQKYIIGGSNPESYEKYSFGTDEENGYTVNTYGLYISTERSKVFDGYSIYYPLYILLERKGKDNKIDYKVVHGVSTCISSDGKKIYWEDAFRRESFSDINRSWSNPTIAVTNVSKFDDPYFKEFDLICLWNKNNNFETLKIKTK